MLPPVREILHCSYTPAAYDTYPPPHPPAHRRTNVMETRSAPASLQLWQFPRQGAAAPSLAYAVVHQGGVCLGVEACRSEGLPGCLVEVR